MKTKCVSKSIKMCQHLTLDNGVVSCSIGAGEEEQPMEYFENVPRRKLSGLLVRKMATISFKSAFLRI